MNNYLQSLYRVVANSIAVAELGGESPDLAPLLDLKSHLLEVLHCGSNLDIELLEAIEASLSTEQRRIKSILNKRINKQREFLIW